MSLHVGLPDKDEDLERLFRRNRWRKYQTERDDGYESNDHD
jgi:hypothetical protein